MAASNKFSVVVIDDDKAVLDSFQFMLEAAGYPVSIYDSARSYMAADENHHSCLILDQNMPEMTGIELATALRRKGSTSPILLVTAAPTPALVKQASRCGIAQVLTKPVAEEEIINFVAAHVGQVQPVHGEHPRHPRCSSD